MASGMVTAVTSAVESAALRLADIASAISLDQSSPLRKASRIASRDGSASPRKNLARTAMSSGALT